MSIPAGLREHDFQASQLGDRAGPWGGAGAERPPTHGLSLPETDVREEA